MKNITFEKKLLNILGKKNYDDIVKKFVQEIREKPRIEFGELGLEDDTLDYYFNDNGLVLMFDKSGKLVTVYIYMIEKDGYKAFSGIYNEFLTNQSNKQEIIRKLGKPLRENNEEYFSYSELIPKWMVYDYKNHTIHFEFYGARDKLAQITIMTPEVAPGRKNAA